MLAAIGYFFPTILGLGGHETQQAIAGNIALHLCLILLVLKFVATIISFSFGFNGGLFGPSLFMGAMLGAAIGLVVQGMGVSIASISLYAIAGMGAMVAGVIGAVFASIIALIEMTGKLSPSLPPIVLSYLYLCTHLSV